MEHDIVIKPNRNRKHYALQVGNDGQIIVRTPIRASKQIINQLIEQNQDWIERQSNIIQQKQNELMDWNDSRFVYFHGKKYQLFKSDGPIVFYEEQVHIPHEMSKTSFLKHQAEIYLPERCLDIAEMMNLSIKDIKTKKLKACWGICNRKQVLTLNIALIQVPTWVSDYVMVHECAHLVHFDHSKAFWELVGQYCDSVKDAKKWLKNHQMVLIS